MNTGRLLASLVGTATLVWLGACSTNDPVKPSGAGAGMVTASGTGGAAVGGRAAISGSSGGGGAASGSGGGALMAAGSGGNSPGGTGGSATGGRGSPGGAGAAGAGGAGTSGASGTGAVAGAATGTIAAGGAAAMPGHKFAATQAVRILVIGSSNEIGTCWRAFLWRKLRDAGLANIDFVGGVSQGPDCGVAGYDKDMQGEDSNLVTNWTMTDVAGWFTTYKPDIVLLHVGGADMLQALPVAGVVTNYGVALQQARRVTPDVEFMNAQHTPMTRAVEETKALNAAIVAWAAQNTTVASPITPVDLYTGLSPDTDTRDGTHLNDVGAEKVAERFFMALMPLFGP